jgi:hypothetical protein
MFFVDSICDSISAWTVCWPCCVLLLFFPFNLSSFVATKEEAPVFFNNIFTHFSTFNCPLLFDKMFVVRVPLVPILQEVLSYCRLPYAAFIHEVSGDAIDLFGIELELPPLFDGDVPRRLFFWASQDAHAGASDLHRLT